MHELLHHCATLVEPVSNRLLTRTARAIALADDKRLLDPNCGDQTRGRDRVRKRDVGRGSRRHGSVWTQGAIDEHGGGDIAYHFRDSLRGAPCRRLCSSAPPDVLLVGGESGYNDIEKLRSCRRAASFAHLRRFSSR